MLTGCGAQQDSSTLTVFAAASLRASFTEIAQRFQRDHPGMSVEFSFAGSSDLVTQLTQGAYADVFASADTRTMDRAAEAGLLDGAPVAFAANSLTIAVAPGNPKGFRSLRDLTAPGVSAVLCAPQVPCGAAATAVERAAGVDVQPVSEESSVTDVLNKVTSGQADAGLVYVTDARGAGDRVTAVDFPEAAQAVNTYPIAVLKESRNSEGARRFLEAVTGPTGREVLRGNGFTTP
ncbi:molybdate-binding protein [Mycobacterium sp. IS-1496]|uniref:molybdate ABC transporter substrate-binding protein n=1 Tax=Mycobacterium sp. IS-1496 TaxID=1772284 RepID=UPI0007415208|nr:molybdate ABC transporter substrate-binding protein [Mycobacterium sp. IS-1496]KUI27958.1 molybdate-binding protein [Mycobacterium sp. IS-1496]